MDLFDNDEQLHIKGISIDWDKISSRSYWRGIQSISGMNHLEFHKPITFFVGENGSGKSTLLEAIAVAYAEIMSFDDGIVHPVSYEETDSYQVTEMFINNREQILRRLLDTD